MEHLQASTVLGRKNFYGNRSRRGAKVAAILYSLIETAARAAIKNPGAVVVPR